jgi:hypothetical protein
LVYAAGIGLLLLGIACSRSTPPAAPDAAARQTMQEQARGAASPAINGGLSITAPTDTTPQPAVVQASVAEELSRFYLQPGYHLEPVLTEPHIREPAAIAFDGTGRMFVLELRSYMQDADATDELLPASQISMHEDTDNDGTCRFIRREIHGEGRTGGGDPCRQMSIGDGAPAARANKVSWELWKLVAVRVSGQFPAHVGFRSAGVELLGGVTIVTSTNQCEVLPSLDR